MAYQQNYDFFGGCRHDIEWGREHGVAVLRQPGFRKLMHDDDDDDGDDEKCNDVGTFEVYRRGRGASEDPLLPAGGRCCCVYSSCVPYVGKVTLRELYHIMSQ